jgi:DNA-binding PadR family transcriptional regulator
VSFPAIREAFGFSDGNLNRHLKVLVDEGWIRSTRSGAGRGSKTTVELADMGRAGLQELRSWSQRVYTLLSSEPVLGQDTDENEAVGRVDDRSRGWEE